MRLLNQCANWALWQMGLLLPQHRKGCRICVIRIDLIGDFVLFLDALEMIRRSFENCSIALVVSESVAPLARCSGSVDEIIVHVDRAFRRNPMVRLAYLLRLYRKGFATAIYPCYSRTRVGDLQALWTGAEAKMGWKTSESHLTAAEGRAGDRIYNRLVRGAFAPDVHEKVRNAVFVEKVLGADAAPSGPGRLAFGPDAARRADALLAKAGCGRLRPIAMLTGASFPIKNWGLHNFRELCLRLLEADGSLTILLCGAAGDAGAAAGPLAGLGTRVVNLAGETDLPALGCLFGRCRLVVGNDTGTMHLAIAVGAPTVCIAGGGHFGRFVPYGDQVRHKFLYHPMPCFHCSWQCIQQQPYCISRVRVDKAIDACLELLRESQVMPQGPCSP